MEKDNIKKIDTKYTGRQFDEDTDRLASLFDNNKISLKELKEQQNEIYKKTSLHKLEDIELIKEISASKHTINAAAQIKAVELICKKYNVSEEKFDKFFEKEVRPTTNIINFNLGGNFLKMNNLIHLKNYLLEGFIKQKYDAEIQDIGTPHTVDIDYSVVKTVPTDKYGRMLKRYKDGFLIVSDASPKDMLFFSMFYDNQEETGSIVTPVLRFGKEVYFLGSINETIENLNFKSIPIYTVFTKAYKNKAFVIQLNNHEGLMNSLERVKKQINNSNTSLKVYKSFAKKTYHGIAFMNGVMDFIEHFNDMKDESLDEEQKIRLINEINSISKKHLLKCSYHFLFGTMVHTFICQILSTEKNKKLIIKKNTELRCEELLNKFFECKNESEIVQELFLFLENKKFSLKDYYGLKEIIYAKKYNQDTSIEYINHSSFSVIDTIDILMNIYFLYNETEEGTKLLGKGPIDTSEATPIDCLYYWKHCDLFSKSFGFIDKSDFPLFIDYNEIFNKNYLPDHINEFRKTSARVIRYNENYQLGDEAAEKTSLLLNEAMNNSTGLLIPYDACIELRGDNIFKYARFIETNKFIHIFLHDENDRYIPELFCKESCEFRYWIVNRAQVVDEPENLRKTFDRLYVKLATGIRNWKVLIERNRTMAVRPRPMVPTGVKSNKKRWIYLPRIKYIDNPDQEQKTRQKKFFNESRKFSGTRRHHTRKLPKGMKPSKTQLVLAEVNNVYLRDNETYVKASVWGVKGMTERQIKYRTEPLTNGILFMPDDEFEKHQEIAKMCPASFEEYCEKYIESLGYQVYKKWNYDGGIDIRGMKDIEDGKVQRLFVQCKHPIESGNPIGPDVVRELQGSVDLEMKDLEDCEIEKMIITSTRYTYKAVEAAEKLGIKLKTTDDMKG